MVTYLTLATALVTGCGADTEPASQPADQQVRTVVQRFGTASARRDVEAICRDLLSRRLVRSVESIGLPCETAMLKGLADVRDPTLRVLSVSVSGDRASALVRSRAEGQSVSEDRIELVREDDEWRIASLAAGGGGGAETTRTVTTPRRTVTTPTRTVTTPTRTVTTPRRRLPAP